MMIPDDTTTLNVKENMNSFNSYIDYLEIRDMTQKKCQTFLDPRLKLIYSAYYYILIDNESSQSRLNSKFEPTHK